MKCWKIISFAISDSWSQEHTNVLAIVFRGHIFIGFWSTANLVKWPKINTFSIILEINERTICHRNILKLLSYSFVSTKVLRFNQKQTFYFVGAILLPIFHVNVLSSRIPWPPKDVTSFIGGPFATCFLFLKINLFYRVGS